MNNLYSLGQILAFDVPDKKKADNMTQRRRIEKRKYPRINTSEKNNWIIKIFGNRGKKIQAKVINLSLGGVAFVSSWDYVLKTMKKNSNRVEIHLPDGNSIDALTTFLRMRPKSHGDECICVLKLTKINKKNTSSLESFLS